MNKVFCPFCGTKFTEVILGNELTYPEIKLVGYKCLNKNCEKQFHIGIRK
jgi:hypothetical protein